MMVLLSLIFDWLTKQIAPPKFKSFDNDVVQILIGAQDLR